MTSGNELRRLLVNGELLRVDVNVPRRGGGDKFQPQTASEARDLLVPQLNSIISQIDALPAALRSEHQLYIETRLLPNFISASDYPSALLGEIGAVAVGSRLDRSTYRTKTRQTQTATRRLVLAIDDEGLSAFADLLATEGKTRTAKQAFEEIRYFDKFLFPGPETIVSSRPALDSGRVTWEAVLHPSSIRGGEPVPIDEETMERWFELVRQHGGEFYLDFIRQLGGLTSTPFTLDNAEADAISRFNPLRTLRPLPVLRPIPEARTPPRVGTRSVSKLAPPTNSSPVRSEPYVAVFDGGIDLPISVVIPNSVVDLTSEPPDTESTDHGTGVTGAVLYGLVGPNDILPRPPLPVDSYRVLPVPAEYEDVGSIWLLDQIKEAVTSGGYKIVNLSVAPEEPMNDLGEPSTWTSHLDQLAWDNDVLFIVAAGNDGHANRRWGAHRVQVPADMANGLGVGASDSATPTRPWTRASYSSMGPGRQGNRVAPAGVQFGGAVDNKFPLLRSNGTFLLDSGTSYAAPVHAHALAELATWLPRSSPSVLRAFSVHFAERHKHHRKMQDEVGYGRFPLTFVNHLGCSPDETHVLYVDQIERHELLGYRLPIPSNFGRVRVRVTLAYASPIDQRQPTEYTQASLGIAFRPNIRMFRISPPKGQKGKPVTLDHTSSEAQELFAQGWEMSQEPVTFGLGVSGGIPEHVLRDSGKWETLRHMEFLLKEGATHEPHFEISYVARRAGAIDNGPTTVPFALLISLEDPTSSGELYDKTVEQFTALRPLARSLAQVRVRGGAIRR